MSSPSQPQVRKRCLLWDWTSTRDHASTPGLQSATADLSGLCTCASSGARSPIVSYHNWNAWSPPELAGTSLPFRPMVRTPAQLASPGEFDWIADSAHEVVHFYNEPERQGIAPGDAAREWRDKMVGVLRKKKGKKLVAPSCANDEGGTKWLTSFMEEISQPSGSDGAEETRPDFIGLHYYSADVQHAKDYLSSMHAQWPSIPVIVSEIGCISRDEGEVKEFSGELARWMDEQDWIDEYGFFGAMRECADDFVSPAAQLMDKEGKWTGLGKWWIGAQ